MPELPEVETIKRRLASVLPGKILTRIEVHADKSFGGNPSQLIGKPIQTVSRRAKILEIGFGEVSLLTHLKMTGQLIYVAGDSRVGGGHPTADWTQELPGKHTRITYHFDDTTKLFFNDMRLFGWMKIMSPAEVVSHYAKLGPDINDSNLTVAYLYEQFQRKSIPIKQALMDPAIVCGVGNIYACDALNLARISPFRPARSLSEIEVAQLFAAAKSVIERGIELQGTTFDGKYVTVDGMAGGYQEEVLAYGREGQPCFNCGSAITKVKLGGRGTYYCGVCQK